MIELYDSEVATIDEVLKTLNIRLAGRREFEAFDREIKERLAEAGFKATVNWWTVADSDGTPIPDRYDPVVTIDGRIGTDGDVLAAGKFTFDHDRQVHEVTNDLLGLGEGGVIKTDKIDPGHKAVLDAHTHDHYGRDPVARAGMLDGLGPHQIHTLYTGLDIPDPITFTVSPDYLNRPNLYPRQATLLKIIFLRDDLFTDYDHAVIDEWEASYADTGHEGICPQIRERIRLLKALGARWFKEVLLVLGRRAGKGHISAIAMSYVLWHYMAKGDPQEFYGVDRDKKLACMIFAGKRDQAKTNLWGDLANVITGSECFTPYINSDQAEKLSVYVPHDFVRLAELERKGLSPGRDLATLEILPKESTMMAGRGPASCVLAFDEMAHVVAAGSNRSAEEVYGASTPSLDQFGQDAFIIEPSSPYQMTGQFYANYQAAVAIDEDTGAPERPNMLMLQLPSWDIYLDWERAGDLPLFPAGFTGDLGEYAEAPPPGFRRLKGAIQTYDREMELLERANPETFAVERRSHFATVVDAYLRKDRIDAMFAPWAERPAEYGPATLAMAERGLLTITYRGHADPSKTNCNFAIAVAHVERVPKLHHTPAELAALAAMPRLAGMPAATPLMYDSHVVFDLIKHWEPGDFPNHIVDYDQISTWILDNVLLAFYPSEFTFDQFNSAQTIQQLNKELRKHRLPKNIAVFEKTATAPHNWKRDETFKTALNLGRIHAPMYDQAHLELQFLQKPPNIDKVVHPTIGPVQTKDVFDAMSECVYGLIGSEITMLREQLGGLRLSAGLQGGVRAFPAMDGERAPEHDPRSALSGFGRRGRAPTGTDSYARPRRR